MNTYDLSAWPLFRSLLAEGAPPRAKTRTCRFLAPAFNPSAELGRHAETVWKYIVRPALLDTDLEGRVADAEAPPATLDDQLVDALLDDDVIIALATGRAPDVFYSIALAQAAARPLIVMVEDGADLGLRPRGACVVTYRLDPDSLMSNANIVKLQRAVRELETQTPRTQPFRAGAAALNGGRHGGASVYERSGDFGYDRRLEMMRAAATRIDLMGWANLALASHPDMGEVLRARAGSDLEIRILQAAPGNPSFAALLGSRDMAKLDAVRCGIEAAAAAWRRLGEASDVKITLRRAMHSLPLANALVTDGEVVSTPYLATRPTRESPTLHAHKGSSFHAVIGAEFDAIWSEAQTLFRTETQRRQRFIAANTNTAPAAARTAPNEPEGLEVVGPGGIVRGFHARR